MLNKPIQSSWPRAIAVAFAVAAGTIGCAHVDTFPVDKDKVENEGLEGIRFYHPEPYVLVSPVIVDGKASGKYTYKIVYLPNYNRAYRMTMSPGFGSATMNPTLSGGWNLTGLNATADSKIAETITAIAGLIPTLPLGGPATAGAGVVVDPDLLKPVLFRFDYTDGKISGLTRIP
jgi:hypothetical protein